MAIRAGIQIKIKKKYTLVKHWQRTEIYQWTAEKKVGGKVDEEGRALSSLGKSSRKFYLGFRREQIRNTMMFWSKKKKITVEMTTGFKICLVLWILTSTLNRRGANLWWLGLTGGENREWKNLNQQNFQYRILQVISKL